MAKSLGELYVKLSARTAGFASELAKAANEGVAIVSEAADKIEGAGEKMASALSDISDGFLAVSAAAGGAVAAAASLGGPVGDAVDDLKNTMLVLAQSVATAMLPLLRELDGMAKGLVSAWRSLDKETKAQVVSFVRFSAIAGTALTVLSKGVVVAKGFFEAFVVAGPVIGGAISALGAFATKAAAVQLSMSGLASASGGWVASMAKGIGGAAVGLVGLLAPVLAVAAAVGGLVLLAGSLYKAWQQFGDGISDWVAKAASNVAALAAQVSDFFISYWTGFAKFAAGLAATVLDLATAQFRRLAALAKPFAKAVGMDTTMLTKVEMMTGDQMMADFVRAAEEWAKKASSAAHDVASALGTGLSRFGQDMREDIAYAVDGAKQLGGAIGGELRSMLSGLLPGLDFSGKGVEDIPRDFKAEAERRDKLNDIWMGEAAGLQAGEFKSALEAEAATAEALFREMAEDYKSVSDAASFAYDAEMDARAEYVASIRAAGEAAAEADAVLREEARRMREERERAVSSALSGFGNTLGGRMGDVGGVANSFAQGTAAAGPVGGAAFAALDLATQSEAFKGVVDVLNGALGAMADILGSVLGPLRPVAGALGTIGVALATAIQPVLKVVADALGFLAPPLMMVGKLVQSLAPVFLALNLGFQAIKLGFELMEPVMKVLFDVMRYTGIVILTVVKALMEAWNAIAETINGFIEKAKKVYAGVGMGGMADVLEGLKVGTLDTAGIQEQLDSLKNTTWDSAMKDATSAADDFAKATRDATDAMLNVPSWWKVNRAMANSVDAGGPPSSGGGGTVHGGPVESPAESMTVNNIEIYGYDIDKAVDEALRFTNKKGGVVAIRKGGGGRGLSMGTA